MPCLEESPKEVDVALQLLDIVTPRLNTNNTQPNDVPVVREVSQTDHLNKRLLTTFLERMNVMELHGNANENNEDDDNTDEFED